MTAEQYIPQESELKINTSFIEQLANLSNTENPTPLDFGKINVSEIRNQLIESGINIGLIENDSNLQESIKDSQFRNENQGKGPAVVAALGGLENYTKVFNWAMQESENQQTLGSGDELSKCRGLMQFIGETIALASGQITPEEYCQKTNLRVGKRYKENAEISLKFGLPTDEEGIKKLKKISSVPKGSAVKAYDFILSLNK